MIDQPELPSPSVSDLPTVPPSVVPLPAFHTEPVRVAGYEILGELGRGGMGVVYKARQTQLKRLVALKMILIGIHQEKEILDRFRTEAEAVAQFHHPNIVQIFDIGQADGIPYFSLEFVDGGSLADYLKARSPSFKEAAALVAQLARAMDDAHRKGIIHRDLKPANVLLAPKRKSAEDELHKGLKHPLEDYTPKIADFGLAKNLAAQSQTARGKMMGTPSYMAPEQSGGFGTNVGPAADIYALGAILYELLTGRPPFRAASAIDTILQVTTEPPKPPHDIRPDVPRELEAIALKCLAKKPRERYHTALNLADDLQHYLEGGKVLALPSQYQVEIPLPAMAPESTPPKRGAGLIWIAVVILLATAAVTGWYYFGR